MSKQVRRLIESFEPTSYDLRITLREATFIGTVTISGRKKQRPSQRITVHAKALKVTGATVIKHTKQGDQEIDVDRINHQATFDEVRLHTKQLLHAGNYTITLRFSGNITTPMNGLYPCYFKHDGVEKHLLATQFESHHAREVFPCIDEPAAKATFDLTLTTANNCTVLGNTPVVKQVTIGSETITTFAKTPKMSTYLLAFAVGEMGYLETKTKRGVVIRTYATPDNVALTKFALDVARKTLDFYEDYFAINYPLPKLDMIALPDFASGAMENWGLVTYREQTMLVDPKNSSLSVKQYVAMVVAHELAHQWFGNLVTMEWWTDLWLNEGFASWIEYLAVDTLFPDWEMWTQFIVDEQHRGLKLDALHHTHPVEVPVNHPDEIRTIFDTISYSKGASVIHMLYGYLGAEAFQKGLRYYLKQHAYGNTETTDLWTALESASKQPVKKFMKAWTGLPGFPLLQVEPVQDGLQLSQQRFYVDQSQKSKKKQTWPIALLASDTTLPSLLDKASMLVKTTATPKLNQGQSGFYRTLYDETQLQVFSQLIAAGKVDPIDRLGLLSDTFEAAKAGYIPTTAALDLLSAYAAENNNAVWDVIAVSIGSTRAVMDDEAVREAMKPYVRKLTAKQIKRLGWKEKKSDSHFDKLLRPTVLGMASLAEEAAVVTEALRQFKTAKIPADIHPDLRGVVYGTAVRHGDAKTYDKLWQWHESTDHSEERVTLAAAITGFKQPALTKRTLGSLQTDSIRLQDVSFWIAYAFMNRYAKRAMWAWLKDNWDWLYKHLGSDLSFYRFPIYVANNFSDPKFLHEYQAFFEPRRSPGFDRSINQGEEILRWQSAWRERDLKAIRKFFAQSTSK